MGNVYSCSVCLHEDHVISVQPAHWSAHAKGYTHYCLSPNIYVLQRSIHRKSPLSVSLTFLQNLSHGISPGGDWPIRSV